MKRDVDFNVAPLLVIWEVTRSCELACRHCRASAENRRDPRELTTAEGYRLIDDVAAMGTPLIIFSGGDPLQRTDLEALIYYAKAAGLRVGTIPATTPRLTKERLMTIKAAGIDQIALSIDGATCAEHDEFRRVEGSFYHAMKGASWAHELDIPLQANTVFGAWNAHRFDALAELVSSLGVVFWEIFLLVPTGRGSELQGCSAEQVEELFVKIHAFSRTANFIVKITEGQHYRRYVAQHRPPAAPGARPTGKPDFFSIKAVHAGNGFCFVDHTGEVYPSGFLPIECGNVRNTSIIETYRNHPVFRDLKNPGLLEGRCAECAFKGVCGGGSRARAYAVTGNLFADDPACIHGRETVAV
jgi:AdoMet-dependent heme synthase